MKITSGECFCGAIKYEIEGPLAAARSCHCSRCRKAFSGAGSAMTFVGPDNFRWIDGDEYLNTYTNKQGAGLGFCSQCGSTLCGIYQGAVFGLTLGTLNGDPDVEIGEHIFVASKAKWDKIGGSAPRFLEGPNSIRE